MTASEEQLRILRIMAGPEHLGDLTEIDGEWYGPDELVKDFGLEICFPDLEALEQLGLLRYRGWGDPYPETNWTITVEGRALIAGEAFDE